ncbi:hypothetical protein DXG01_012518 [Tephrocybe rancida]|nr:hypothetical protein DXG01_012518 [Tephrocybe rancida]
MEARYIDLLLNRMSLQNERVQASILPVIVTNHTVTIAAELEDGRRLVGQCEISHPVSHDADQVDITISDADAMSPMDGMGEVISQRQNMMFESTSKSEYEPLGSRISSSFKEVSNAQIHIGALVKRGLGLFLWFVVDKIGVIMSLKLRAVSAMARTLNGTYQTQPYGLGNANTTYPISAFVTHLVYLKGGSVQVDMEHITGLGVECVEIADGHTTSFSAELVERAINEILSEE